MLIFSLRDAARLAGTSKSTIWRAIRAGRLEAGRTEFGEFMIDPNELLRVYPQKQEVVSPRQAVGKDARQGDADGVAVRMATLETELQALRTMVNELRVSRDAWRVQAERATEALIGATSSDAR
jgi:hypothetical protein